MSSAIIFNYYFSIHLFFEICISMHFKWQLLQKLLFQGTENLEMTEEPLKSPKKHQRIHYCPVKWKQLFLAHILPLISQLTFRDKWEALSA